MQTHHHTQFVASNDKWKWFNTVLLVEVWIKTLFIQQYATWMASRLVTLWMEKLR